MACFQSLHIDYDALSILGRL